MALVRIVGNLLLLDNVENFGYQKVNSSHGQMYSCPLVAKSGQCDFERYTLYPTNFKGINVQGSRVNFPLIFKLGLNSVFKISIDNHT